MIKYIIMGRSSYGTEEIDEFDTFPEAKENLKEYRTAFGTGWYLWIKRIKERIT